MNAAHLVHDNQKYYDVHVNIFTPESFFSILKRAMQHEIIFFEVEEFLDTQIGQIEFAVHLKKLEKEPPAVLKSKCLASIPRLDMESVLSPYMPQVKSLSNALENSLQINVTLHNELEMLRSNSQNEITALRNELKISQAMLARKSVRLILFLIDKVYSWFKK